MNQNKQQANREEWEAHVTAWGQSGLTQSAYSRAHGLSPRLLSAWIGRLKKSLHAPKALTIIPVVVKDIPSKMPCDHAISFQHASGWHMSLPKDIQASWVGALMKALT